MRLMNKAGVRIAIALAGPAACLVLAACAANPNSKAYTAMLTGSANPIGVQGGRLTIIALDSTDGEPLMGAVVEVVAAAASVREPQYFRRSSTSDRKGAVTFSNVPRLVDVSIKHDRGAYSLDGYAVPQGSPSEFRVLIDTTSRRTRSECTTATSCFD